MYASINGKTIVTVQDEQGKFHAVEIVTGTGFNNERNALLDGIDRVLFVETESDTRAEAQRLLDEDEYLAGKTNAQKAAILRAAKVLGRTVYLHVKRADGLTDAQDFEVRIVGTAAVGLKNIETGKADIVHYEQIEGGYTNDPE